VNSASRIGGPLRLTHQAAFWLFWVLVSGCALFVAVEQAQYFSSYPAAWVLSIVLLVATAIPAGLILYRLDDFEPEPATLIVMAVIWGGVVAVTFSGIVNELTYGFLQHIVPATTVDHWAAVAVGSHQRGVVQGAGAGRSLPYGSEGIRQRSGRHRIWSDDSLGFQIMENVQYFMFAAAGQGGATDAVVSMFFLRVVLSGLYSHMLFTGFLGFGFAYFVTQRGKSMGKRIGILLGCVLLSWGAHFVWNSPWLESLMAKGTGAFAVALVIKGLPS